MYRVTILADSKDPRGNRLTTFELVFPRIILSQFSKHRMFSFNTSSSRAVPFEKMVKMVQEEPFMWVKVIMTTSEEGLQNFFGLRCPSYLYDYEDTPKYFRSMKDWVNYYNSNEEEGTEVHNLSELDWLQFNTSQADIHIQKLAEMMWDAYNESTLEELESGWWHIPYLNEINKVADEVGALLGKEVHFLTSTLVAVSSALAARVSYTTIGSDFDIDHERLLKLHDRLVEDRHLSVFEHCARVMSNEEYDNFFRGDKRVENFLEEEEKYLSQFGWCNNLKGFIPYRYMIEKGEELW